MAGERGGRRLAALALVISLIALGISILAYQEVGEPARRLEAVRGPGMDRAGQADEKPVP